jgi:hypothetical protein
MELLMYSKSNFLKKSQPKSHSTDFGPKFNKDFHPSSCAAYLINDYTIPGDGLRDMRLHMGREHEYNLHFHNYWYGENIGAVLNSCKERQLLGAIGLGLKFPDLFQIAIQYKQLKAEINAEINEKIALLESEKEQNVKKLHIKLESEYGKSITLEPFTKEEYDEINQIHDFINKEAGKEKIAPLDYLFKNPDLVINNTTGINLGMNRE